VEKAIGYRDRSLILAEVRRLIELDDRLRKGTGRMHEWWGFDSLSGGDRVWWMRAIGELLSIISFCSPVWFNLAKVNSDRSSDYNFNFIHFKFCANYFKIT
jgi:hypothetical protein